MAIYGNETIAGAVQNSGNALCGLISVPLYPWTSRTI